MMRLAAPIIIILAGEAVALRPSLACAMQLERRPGSFKGLLDEIADDSLSAASAIIAPHHSHPMLAIRIMDAGLETLRPALMDYVLQCAGIDPDAPKTASEGPSVSFAEHLQHLYRIGTGWLGWTPDATLDATPAEIMEAYRGRMDMLKAIFGSADDDQPQPSPGNLDDKFRAVFGSFGTTIITPDRRAA